MINPREVTASYADMVNPDDVEPDPDYAMNQYKKRISPYEEVIDLSRCVKFWSHYTRRATAQGKANLAKYRKQLADAQQKLKPVFSKPVVRVNGKNHVHKRRIIHARHTSRSYNSLTKNAV